MSALLITLALSLVGVRSDATPEAEALPPWLGAAPDWAQSVRIVKGDQPLLLEPARGAKRRGTAWREALLPLYDARLAPGCGGPWLLVGPQAWVCQDDVSLSGAAGLAATATLVAPSPDGLPFRYHFVGVDGSLAYARFDDVDVGEPQMSLEKGFAVAIVEERQLGGEIYGRTNRGLWLPMRDLGLVRPLPFRGAEIEGATDGRIPVGWVLSERATVYERRNGVLLPTAAHKVRFDEVGWLEEARTPLGLYARIDDRSWMRASDLRHPTLAAPPSEATPDERWIDIELASQTLVAYEGERPVFATLVSTGRGTTKGHPLETPRGVHRIWVKLFTATMDNLENEWANEYYRIEDVPYVQFFSKGVGLHATFWHRKFGQVRSHGCVNLTPLDAERLFHFTGPRVPAGWTAALPTSYDPGTIVRVR